MSRRALAAALGATLTALTLTAAIPAQADTAAPQPPAAQATGPLTADQASAEAKSSGKAVVAEAATTPTAELTANPDGSFTLNQAVAPVRTYRDGGWKPLDATLVKASDGSIAPKTTSGGLILSGGGSGPLAQMKSGNRSLSMSLPDALAKNLPAPVLDGPTATYSLLTGIDLKVTADPQGGFSEVLVVKDAAAAANPALKSLSFTTRTTGVDLATDAAGNITAADKHGQVVFSAPAPVRGVWDSAVDTSLPTVTDPVDGRVLDARSGEPARSSDAGPGASAHTAPLKAEYATGAITLTPDPALLSGQNTTWPLYIDPTYSSAGGSALGWTYVSSAFRTTSYWKTTDSEGLRVGDNTWDSPYYVGRAFARMSVPSSIYGAQIASSTFYATETWAPSCSARDVELWNTGAISSKTTWDNQPSWDTRSATRTVANGYSSSCPTASVGFDTTAVMQSAANNNWAEITLGLRASNESDGYGWKKFQPSSMSMSTTYNHAPSTPTTLSTSPATSCTAATPTVVGNGDVVLRAAVSDPDGGSLGVAFTLVKTATGAVVASSTTGGLSATSGTTAQLLVSRQTLAAAANNGVMTFSWNVYTNDGNVNSATSTTCKFTFDPTVPGKPTASIGPGPFTVGTPTQVAIAHNLVGTVPTSYVYQLNGAAPSTVTAVSGDATVSIKPTRVHNVLTVTALSVGGNPSGDTEIVEINADPPSTASENDLTGDGRADLTAVGDQSSLPAGLWLAGGAAGKTLNTAADNLGSAGTAGSNPSTADWNGTQAIVGHFRSGSGFNDVLQYNPATGAGLVLYGNGDGSALSPTVGVAVPSVAFSSRTGKATWVANAGQLYTAATEGELNPFPSLLSILDGSLYLQGTAKAPGGFIPAEINLRDKNPTAADTDTCTCTWAGWTIVTALDRDGMPNMFARSDTGGQLYYYSAANLLAMAQGGTATPVLMASTGWSKAAVPTLQAADIDGNGTTDLWSVNAAGSASANLFDGTSLTVASTQNLTAPTHTWAFNDDSATGTAIVTAADTTGNAPMTGDGTMANRTSPAALWHTGDLYTPDALLNTAPDTMAPDSKATGTIATTGPVVDTTKSFTVDVWAKPTNYGGVLASGDANNASGFIIYPDSMWRFGMATADDTNWSYDLVNGPAVTFSTWTHVTAAFNATNSTMYLYINGQLVGTTKHTARIASTGPTRVSGYKYKGAPAARYSGQIANLRTYATALDGTQSDIRRAADNTWSTPTTVSALPDTAAVAAAGLPNGNTVHITLAGGNEYAQWQYGDGTWGPITPIDTTDSNNHAVTGISAIAAAADSTGTLQILSITNGTLHHQTWNATTGWSKNDTPPGAAANVTAIAAAGLADGSAQFMSVIGGVEYHQARYANRTWSNFNQLGNSGVTAVAAAANPDKSVQFMSVVGGGEYHQIRNMDGTWTTFNPLGSTGPTGVTAVAATGAPDGSAQFAYISGNNAYWQMRNSDKTWATFTQQATGVSTITLAGYPTATTGNPWYNTSHLITTS